MSEEKQNFIEKDNENQLETFNQRNNRINYKFS